MFPLKINNYVGLFYCAKYVSSKIAVELHMERKEKENSINETRFYYTLPSQYYTHEFRFILAYSSSISSGSWWIQLIALFTMRSTEVPRYKKDKKVLKWINLYKNE